MEQLLKDSFTKLRSDIPRIADSLFCPNRQDIAAWSGIIDGKLLTRLSPDFPTMATICGGGSSGKSTLFNSLVGEKLSPVGGRAGMNRRALVSAHSALFNQTEFVAALFEPFGCLPEPLKDQQDLTVAGGPFYVASDALPQNLILVDTPDFDTGSQGIYTNREVARQALEASDILIYVFTNSNYNNRENTDYISRMLTSIGMRKCFLVYRVYPSFDEAEVLEHAATVARNLYGRDSDHCVLGVYRTDEDNEVAAGRQHMNLRPVRNKDLSMMNALGALDSRKLRLELLASIMEDVLIKAREFLQQAKISRDELGLYLNAMQLAQSQCVQEALQHFPTDRVIKRFAEIWMSKDPPHVRAMRTAGRIIDLPFRILFSAARQIIKKPPDPAGVEPQIDFSDKVKEDLLQALNSMYYRAVGSEISVSSTLKNPLARLLFKTVEQIRAGKDNRQRPFVETVNAQGALKIFVSAHPVVADEQEKLQRREWKSVLQSILSRQEVIFELSEGIEKELNDLADRFRDQMDFMSKIRETFSAFLNVVPATAAITYILSTGDPVGAAGIKVKLTGMFGLHDLYALVAIPATSGLKKADQNQLDAMLGPIVQTWLSNKLADIHTLFEQEITGGIIRAATDALASSQDLIGQIEINLDSCEKAMKP
ncbi:MAG: dynamin family protein [Desulfobacterales bacterium]|uniref:Dynamin family protein n=1 Tax=Candidatus Desulfatibia vada TaxID=2841696 RepID=A0A8J6TW51_9BACT|nr:dynamin family protein [Candidatus Desulfatibia vada]MBL6972075.1 dynamin family protein [Desulfobacterales bacterium]